MIIDLLRYYIVTEVIYTLFWTWLKNKELYKIQENLEQSISSNTGPEEKDLIISFPGVEQSVRMPGTIHKEKAKIQGEEISISIFIPKQ